MRTSALGWAEAVRMINDPSYDMVILDELNIVLKYQYLDLDAVLDVFSRRRGMLHVAITGRHAPEPLIALADLASEIRPIKHPYQEQGIKAQKGAKRRRVLACKPSNVRRCSSALPGRAMARRLSRRPWHAGMPTAGAGSQSSRPARTFSTR